MEYRRLGKSGLQVSVLSLGSWITFGKQIGDDTAEALMRTAYEQGVNFFDNAEIYARGESEAVMGRILKKMNWTAVHGWCRPRCFLEMEENCPTKLGSAESIL